MSQTEPPNSGVPSPEGAAGHASSNSNQGRSLQSSTHPQLSMGHPTPYRTASSSRHSTGDFTLDDFVTQVRSLLAIIRRRWLSGFIAASLITSVFVIFVLREKHEFTAVSTLLAQSALDEVLHSDQQAREHKDAKENFLQNHLSVMKSRRFSMALAQEFTEEEQFRITRAFMKPGRSPTLDSFEKMLASRMDATRQREREFFTLSFRHPDSEIAKLVANRMTATYLKLVQNEIKETNLAAAEMLRLQAEQLQEEISELEGKQRDFREEHNIVSLTENQGIVAEGLRKIDQNRTDARMKRFRLESQMKEVEEDLAEEGLPLENPFLANYANNERLRQELDKLIGEREVLSLRYGRNHPRMKDVDSRIVGVEENLRRNFDLAYRDLQDQYQTAASLEARLDDEFKEKFSEGIKVGRVADQFLVIKSEVEAKRTALRDLLRRVSDAVVVSNLPVDVMRVVDPAFIAKPRLSKKKLAAAFTFLLAGGAFLGVPLGLQLFDQRLKCATDIEKELNKGLLGGIPRLKKIRASDRPHVVRDNANPENVEPFMAIVAQLELLSKQQGSKSFVVTSTTTAEGKSTMSSNLSSGFAQIKRKTLIIDGDLRRPCIHQFNRIKKPGGLLRWAEEGYPLDDVMSENSPLGIQELKSGCYLLPAGGVFPLPSKILVTAKVKALIQKLEEHFEVILVDTPPAGLYADAFIFAKAVGETVLVARESKAPVPQIRRVIEDLDNTAAPVIGVVLNGYTAGSLNPRLAYGERGKYKYSYKPKKQAKATAGAASKSLVSKLMKEEAGSENEEDSANEGTTTAVAKKPSKRALRKGRKGGASSQSLISKLMSDPDKLKGS